MSVFNVYYLIIYNKSQVFRIEDQNTSINLHNLSVLDMASITYHVG